jgi:hypothetical protein
LTFYSTVDELGTHASLGFIANDLAVFEHCARTRRLVFTKDFRVVKIGSITRIDAKYIATRVELHFSACVVSGFAGKERARFHQVAIIVVKVVEFQIASRASTLKGIYHEQQEQQRLVVERASHRYDCYIVSIVNICFCVTEKLRAIFFECSSENVHSILLAFASNGTESSRVPKKLSKSCCQNGPQSLAYRRFNTAASIHPSITFWLLSQPMISKPLIPSFFIVACIQSSLKRYIGWRQMQQGEITAGGPLAICRVSSKR